MTMFHSKGMPMTVEVRKNGALILMMTPGDAIDSAILEAMAQRSQDNPATLHMTYKDGVAVVRVDTK